MPFRELGPIRQVAYVVHDVRAAMAHWTGVLGVGPFFFFKDAPVMDFAYRGSPCAGRLSVGFANSGPLQIELIQPLDHEPSVFRDFLDTGREGQQHIAYWTEELDHWIDRATRAGYAIVQSGCTGAADGRFVYVDTRGPNGTVLEISEVRGRKKAFFEQIARVAADWDGTEPVRHAGI